MDSNIGINSNSSFNAVIPPPPVKKLSGWASFFGVLTIIYGALSAIFLVGIPFIFAGVKLMKAVSVSKEQMGPYGAQKTGEVIDNLNAYFKIMGITTIVIIALYILIVIGMVIFGIFAAMNAQH